MKKSFDSEKTSFKKLLNQKHFKPEKEYELILITRIEKMVSLVYSGLAWESICTIS